MKTPLLAAALATLLALPVLAEEATPAGGTFHPRQEMPNEMRAKMKAEGHEMRAKARKNAMPK